MATLLILGASGTMGRLIAREAARRDQCVVLGGRRAGELVELASTLPSGQARAAVVDITDAASLQRTIADVDVVLNTIGPFTRLAEPVVSACIGTGKVYIDIANELPAVQGSLDRDAEARREGATLITGAGFGVVATETLALLLAEVAGQPLQRIQVAAAQAVAYQTRGVQASVAVSLEQGSPRYEDGHLVVGALGEGATVLQFPDGPRTVIPVPTGDLIAARRATGAPNVVAYMPAPAERGDQVASADLHSLAMAIAELADGRRQEAHLAFGEGFEASAAIAVEVAVRSATAPRPGAWTPGQLYGREIAQTCGADVRGPAATEPDMRITPHPALPTSCR